MQTAVQTCRLKCTNDNTIMQGRNQHNLLWGAACVGSLNNIPSVIPSNTIATAAPFRNVGNFAGRGSSVVRHGARD